MGDMVSGLKKLRKKAQTSYANVPDEAAAAEAASAPARSPAGAEESVAATVRRNESAAAMEAEDLAERKRKALQNSGYTRRGGSR